MNNHLSVYRAASSMVRSAANGGMAVRPWGYLTPQGSYAFGEESGTMLLDDVESATIGVAGLLYAGDFNYYY